MKTSHTTSLLKGVSWRAVAFVDTALVSFWITGSFSTAIKISIIELLTKIFLFYIHERVWLKFSFGRKQGNDLKYRSLIKAMSWRICGSTDTVIITFLITGKCAQAFNVGFLECGTKILLYFAHERVWQKFLPRSTE